MRESIAETLRRTGFGRVDGTLLDEAIQGYYEPQINSWEVFPDTKETLEALRDRRVPIGLVSNTRSDYCARHILERHDLTYFFRVITTSAVVGIRKPRPQIFLEALGQLKAAAKDTAFVGDSLGADIAGARALHMKAIHVLRGPINNGPNRSEEGISPDATVHSLNEALRNIVNWMGDT